MLTCGYLSSIFMLTCGYSLWCYEVFLEHICECAAGVISFREAAYSQKLKKIITEFIFIDGSIMSWTHDLASVAKLPASTRISSAILPPFYFRCSMQSAAHLLRELAALYNTCVMLESDPFPDQDPATFLHHAEYCHQWLKIAGENKSGNCGH